MDQKLTHLGSSDQVLLPQNAPALLPKGRDLGHITFWAVEHPV